MSTIKKTVSVLLAVMMIFSMLAVASVSAAETTTGGPITVSSNLCDDVKYTYDEDDTQVEVTYFLQSDKMILNAQGTVSYDSTVLELADTNTPATNMPVLSTDSAVINYKLNNRVKFNSTSLDLFDFTTEEQKNEMERQIKALDGLNTVTYKTKEEAPENDFTTKYVSLLD